MASGYLWESCRFKGGCHWGGVGWGRGGWEAVELARVSMRWLHSPFLSFLIDTDMFLCSLFSLVAWTLRGWALPVLPNLCQPMGCFADEHVLFVRHSHNDFFLNISSVVLLDAGTSLLQLLLKDPLDLEWCSMLSLILASGMLLSVSVRHFNNGIYYFLPLLMPLFCKSSLILIKMPVTQLLTPPLSQCNTHTECLFSSI